MNNTDNKNGSFDLAGNPPVPARLNDRQRVEQLATQILAARKRGWWIEQIAETLNKEFRKAGQPEINRSTFCKYISQLCTQKRLEAAAEAVAEGGLRPQSEPPTELEKTTSQPLLSSRSMRNPRSHGPT